MLGSLLRPSPRDPCWLHQFRSTFGSFCIYYVIFFILYHCLLKVGMFLHSKMHKIAFSRLQFFQIFNFSGRKDSPGPQPHYDYMARSHSSLMALIGLICPQCPCHLPEFLKIHLDTAFIRG